MSRPELFACLAIVILLIPVVAVVWALWKLSRKVGPRWPVKLRSTTAIVLLSFIPVVVDGAGALVVALHLVSLSAEATCLAIMVAGALGGIWGLFLLFLTRGFVTSSPSALEGLRVWLLLCLCAAGFAVVLGFGIGISQGVH